MPKKIMTNSSASRPEPTKVLNVTISLEMSDGAGYAERTFQMTRFLTRKSMIVQYSHLAMV